MFCYEIPENCVTVSPLTFLKSINSNKALCIKGFDVFNGVTQYEKVCHF
jgi:hypothetical protein